MNNLVKNIGYNNKLHIAYPFILEAVIHGDLSALRLLVICLTDIVTEHLIDVDLFALLYFNWSGSDSNLSTLKLRVELHSNQRLESKKLFEL